jgi:hypothetical protein
MGNESSGGGGGGGNNSTPGDHHSSSTAWSQPSAPSAPSASPSYDKCAVSQQLADNLCDRIGTGNDGVGKAQPGLDISDGIRCLQAQADADKACGK